MNQHPKQFTTQRAKPAKPQPDSRGLNFYESDASLLGLQKLYMAEPERTHMAPHFRRLGSLVGAELDDLASAADKSPPVLHARNRQGEDVQSIEKSPAYKRMEEIAFGEFAIAALSHRPAFGWSKPLSAATKYTLTYLFAQSEFGLLCPVSMTDSLTRTIRKYADETLLARYLPGLLGEDLDTLLQGAMFMTERFAGSDVGATETRAVKAGDPKSAAHWQLTGQKWFCSNVDAGLALVLARPEGSGAGSKGLGLFLMPRQLPDGQPNNYRIVRLKDKLGTRSMASGEIDLNGAVAYLVGDPGAGFKQIAEMVNQSRLSNAVRSAGMMRRSVHEALTVALERVAFGQRLIELALVRRQLIKMILPTEQAASLCFFTAQCLDRADAGDAHAQKLRRILTPLVKLRACRDARKVAGDGMELRGGTGYIEEWIEPRLVRDTHLGSIWEGTTNIIALDVIRAAAKEQAHGTLAGVLKEMLAAAPADLAKPLMERLDATMRLVQHVADANGAADALARGAATGLYNVASAVLFSDEAKRLNDPRRLDLASLTLRHKLQPRDPLAPDAPDDSAAADRVIDALIKARTFTQTQ